MPQRVEKRETKPQATRNQNSSRPRDRKKTERRPPDRRIRVETRNLFPHSVNPPIFSLVTYSYATPKKPIIYLITVAQNSVSRIKNFLFPNTNSKKALTKSFSCSLSPFSKIIYLTLLLLEVQIGKVLEEARRENHEKEMERKEERDREDRNSSDEQFVEKMRQNRKLFQEGIVRKQTDLSLSPRR